MLLTYGGPYQNTCAEISPGKSPTEISLSRGHLPRVGRARVSTSAVQDYLSVGIQSIDS